MGRAHVGADRHVHADVAGGAREDGADGEAARPWASRARTPSTTNSTTPTMAMVRVLAIQVGLGARLDGRGDFLHAGVAGRLRHDPADREDAVQDREHAGANREPQREVSGHVRASQTEDSLESGQRSGDGLSTIPCPAAKKGAGLYHKGLFQLPAHRLVLQDHVAGQAVRGTAGSPRPGSGEPGSAGPWR